MKLILIKVFFLINFSIFYFIFRSILFIYIFLIKIHYRPEHQNTYVTYSCIYSSLNLLHHAPLSTIDFNHSLEMNSDMYSEGSWIWNLSHRYHQKWRLKAINLDHMLIIDNHRKSPKHSIKQRNGKMDSDLISIILNWNQNQI